MLVYVIIKEICSLLEKVTQGDIDLDSVMAGSVSGGKHHGVYAKHLSKIWCIDHDKAKRILDITSQLAARKKILDYLEITVLTTKCSDIKELKIISLWILSLLQRKQVNHLEEIIFVNYL